MRRIMKWAALVVVTLPIHLVVVLAFIGVVIVASKLLKPLIILVVLLLLIVGGLLVLQQKGIVDLPVNWETQTGTTGFVK